MKTRAVLMGALLAGLAGACDGPVQGALGTISATVVSSAGPLGGVRVEVRGSKGSVETRLIDSTAGGRAFFVLAAGRYTVKATALDAKGAPAARCTSATAEATVKLGRTTTVDLDLLCTDGNGGLDVSVAIRRAPVITALSLSPGTLVGPCESVTLMASAMAEGGAPTFAWEIVRQPPAATAAITPVGPATARFEGCTAGEYKVRLTVTDVLGHTAALVFPIHVVGVSSCGAPGCPDAGAADAAAPDAADAGAPDASPPDEGPGVRDAAPDEGPGSPDAQADTAGEEFPPLPPVQTPEGVPSGNLVQLSIGPAGGSLLSSDGVLEVRIPAGALAAPVTIGIQRITNLAPEGTGDAYQLTPTGQAFAVPIEISMEYTILDLRGSALEDLVIASQDGAGFWHDLGPVSVDTATQRITVPAAHFSGHALRRGGPRLTPVAPVVAPGGSIVFVVQGCGTPTPAGGLPFCPGAFGWSVNGVNEGNATIGTVLPLLNVGNYTAPNAAPSPRTVTLRVNFFYKNQPRVLETTVTITQEAWKGTVDRVFMLMGDAIMANGDLTFYRDDMSQTFVPQGTVQYREQVEGPVCNAEFRFNAFVGSAEGSLTVDAVAGTYRGTGLLQTVPLRGWSSCGGGAPSGGGVVIAPYLWWNDTGLRTFDPNTGLIEGTDSIGWRWRLVRVVP